MTSNFSLKPWICTGLLLSTGALAMAQRSGKNPAGTDTTGKPPAIPPVAKSGPRSYREVITGKAQTEKGLFLVHKVDDKYLIEIPEEMLNRDFLFMTRVAKAGADLRGSGSMSGYAGDAVNSNVISFQKGPNNKLFLLKKSFSEFSADSTREMFTAVTRSNMQPIAASFDIKAASSDSNGVVIDFTDYIAGDNDVLHFDNDQKKNWKIGGMQADKSYIAGVSSFPLNTNIRTVKTYTRQGEGLSGNTTIELTTSIIVLPKEPMQPRYFDPRVGYFAVGYTDFDQNPQGVKQLVLAKRWRLEPRPEDVDRYKKGELVEPQKPIVIYIDPATPKKWIPYLIQGVNDWQKAFEKAGFKNAIVAKPAPTPSEDPGWSMDDARNSVIVYKPSSVANASGPSTADPRSGEILETHINWYHNVMELLRNWYMVQAAAVDPRARKMQFDDELMGQLIRFVSSHEVGHTLGLRHNFGSSSTVPVEKLRDKQWVEENGHTPSIMDYARFNYVAQPEDNISEKGIFPRIGDYDKWAIEWGYKWMGQPIEAETATLSKLTTEKQINKRLWFGTEINRDDPRSQNEDLGDNAMIAGNYGIKNLQRILPELTKWTATSNEGYANLAAMYTQVTTQFGRYIGHVVKNIGGIMETPKTVEQAGPVYERVSKERQKEAMLWLQKNLFTTPSWLLNKDILNKTGTDGVVMIGKLQDQAMNKLFDGRMIDKLITAEAELGSATYTAAEFMTDLRNIVWTEVAARKPIDVFRRNLQKDYIIRVDKVLNPPPGKPSSTLVSALANAFGVPSPINETGDAFSILKANMKALRAEIRAALPAITDKATRYHLDDMVERLNIMLNPK